MTFVAVVLFGLGFVMLTSAIEGVSLSETLAGILSGTYNTAQTPTTLGGGGQVTHQ